jgi:hypothetical protein
MSSWVSTLPAAVAGADSVAPQSISTVQNPARREIVSRCIEGVNVLPAMRSPPRRNPRDRERLEGLIKQTNVRVEIVQHRGAVPDQVERIKQPSPA